MMSLTTTGSSSSQRWNDDDVDGTAIPSCYSLLVFLLLRQVMRVEGALPPLRTASHKMVQLSETVSCFACIPRLFRICTSILMRRYNVWISFPLPARLIGSARPPHSTTAVPLLIFIPQFSVALVCLLVFLSFCPNDASRLSDRFCDPLLMAHLSIDQRSSHCLDSSWQVPPSAMVTLYFTVSRCIPSSRKLLSSNANQIGGYAVLTEGIFLLKRFRPFGPGDFDVPLNDSFVLPRYFADRVQPVPLEILLIDHEEGLSSRQVWVSHFVMIVALTSSLQP